MSVLSNPNFLRQLESHFAVQEAAAGETKDNINGPYNASPEIGNVVMLSYEPRGFADLRNIISAQSDEGIIEGLESRSGTQRGPKLGDYQRIQSQTFCATGWENPTFSLVKNDASVAKVQSFLPLELGTINLNNICKEAQQNPKKPFFSVRIPKRVESQTSHGRYLPIESYEAQISYGDLASRVSSVVKDRKYVNGVTLCLDFDSASDKKELDRPLNLEAMLDTLDQPQSVFSSLSRAFGGSGVTYQTEALNYPT